MESLRQDTWVLETPNPHTKQPDERANKTALPSLHSTKATEQTVQEVINTPDREEDLSGTPPHYGGQMTLLFFAGGQGWLNV